MNAATESTQTHPDYIKIYAALVVLFIISMLGPLFGAPALTIFLAFSIAVVKAGLVAAYFMHLNIEKRYIWFVLFVMLTFMAVLYAGVAPDVMKQSGQNWRQEGVASSQ
jgi:caa(3)-type oxidase subunit IV